MVQNHACHVELLAPFDPEDPSEVDRLRELEREAVAKLSAAGAFFSRPYGSAAPAAFERNPGSYEVLKKVKSIFDDQEKTLDRYQQLLYRDKLTNLGNRRYLLEIAPSLLAQVVRDQRYLTAILLDLDHFKHINDRYGHLAGDAVLGRFAMLLKANSRSSDYLFRIGGEEFLILNLADEPEGSVVQAEKIRELVDNITVEYQEFEIPISVSSGVSCCFGQQGDVSLSRLMREADTALYQAKAQGRNRVVLHASCHTAKAQSRDKSQRAVAPVRKSSSSPVS